MPAPCSVHEKIGNRKGASMKRYQKPMTLMRKHVSRKGLSTCRQNLNNISRNNYSYLPRTQNWLQITAFPPHRIGGLTDSILYKTVLLNTLALSSWPILSCSAIAFLSSLPAPPLARRAFLTHLDVFWGREKTGSKERRESRRLWRQQDGSEPLGSTSTT